MSHVGRQARAHALESAVWKVLIDTTAADPELTVEEELAALLSVAHRLTVQRTPPAADPAPAPAAEVVAYWARAFEIALAHASSCPACGRPPSQPCRCYVPERPDPYPAALTAVYPLIAAHARATNGAAS